MKKNISVLLLLSLLLCGCNAQTPETTVEPGNPVLTSFSATDLDGNTVDQQILSGHKLTMINVWGTFCEPCIREMPDLGELHTAYGDDFQVIGIAIDITDRNLQPLPDMTEKAKQIITETGADYLHLRPSKSLNETFLSEVTSVPVTIFVDENGNQIGQTYIGAKAKEQWQEIIEALLKQL